MSDITTFDLLGPVRSLRVEHCEWDVTTEAWQPPRGHTVFVFRRDGKLENSEGQNFDGSRHRTERLYDLDGRLTETQFATPGGPVTRTLHRYDQAGRLLQILEIAADETTREAETWTYDDAGRATRHLLLRPRPPGAMFVHSIEDDHGSAIETLVHDANGRLVTRILLTRDNEGRLLRQTDLAVESSMEHFAQAIENAPPDERAQVKAAIEKIFAPGRTMSEVTYRYSPEGRLVERALSMGGIDGGRTTFEYDGQGRKIGETTSERSRTHHVRLQYRCDPQGNWTEREVWSLLEPNPNFQPASIERGEITYYEM